MTDDKLERVFQTADPGRRAILKKLVLSAAFVVPIIASFSVTDLRAQAIGSRSTTSIKTSGMLSSTSLTTMISLSSTISTMTSSSTTLLTTTP